MVENFSPKLAFLTSLTLLSLSLASGFSGAGSGTAEDPYQISNLDELNQTREELSAHYQLVSDIDASPTQEWDYNETLDEYMGWRPIGNSSSHFQGKFNGSGHRIEDLFINRPADDKIGLFGATNNSKISRIAITSSNISGGSYVAPLAGKNNGNITLSYATGNVSSTAYGGGLTGSNSGNSGYISKSYSTTDVFGDTYIGGFVGYSSGNISESYSVGHSDIAGFTLIGIGVENNTESSYWDVNTSNQDASAGGTGLTTSEMKNKSNLDGFDFTNTWEFIENRNNGYPVLQTFDLGPGEPPKISISWTDNSDNEDGFRLYSNVSGSFKQIGAVDANNQTFLHSLPEQGSSRYVCYQVTAYNDYGESDPVEGCITP